MRGPKTKPQLSLRVVRSVPKYLVYLVQYDETYSMRSMRHSLRKGTATFSFTVRAGIRTYKTRTDGRKDRRNDGKTDGWLKLTTRLA